MQNNTPYNALIIDDHPLVILAVEMLLTRENIAVVGHAANGADAIQAIQTLCPDIIILDIAIPIINGLEVISRIRTMGVQVKILVFTSQPASSFVARCRLAGASGFVEKDEDFDDLLQAVRAIRAGYTFFPAEDIPCQGTLYNEVKSEEIRLASLSDREMMVLVYLAKGLSNIEIAEELTLSRKTISTYKTRLLTKLGIKTVVDVIDMAHRHNLVD